MANYGARRSSIISGGITVTETDPGEGFGMSESNWDRLYRHVDRIKQPPRWPENLMWSSITLAVGSAISFVLWRLGGETAVDWQGWIYGSATAAFLVIAVISGAFIKGGTDELVRTKGDILEDMREIHVPLSAHRISVAQGKAILARLGLPTNWTETEWARKPTSHYIYGSESDFESWARRAARKRGVEIRG